MQVEEEELLCDICLQGYIQEAGRNPLGHDRCQICTRSMPTAPSARWYTNSFLLVVIQLVEFRTSKAICRIPRSGKDMVKNLLTMKRETYWHSVDCDLQFLQCQHPLADARDTARHYRVVRCGELSRERR